jgi:Zn-dependent protease with chaperone function
VAVIVLLLGLFYAYGIPFVARLIAERIPDSVTQQISTQTLDVLERTVLEPSTLAPAEQERMSGAFNRLLTGTRQGRYRLLFRMSEELGANAIALPSGTMVVTDTLVRLARDDREILGVLGHEVGHVEGRHGLRLIVQGSVLTLAIGWLVGDFTSVVTLAPAVLLQARYSRGFEREADVYAANLLRSRGISPSALADMLERIDAWERSGRKPVSPTRSADSTPDPGDKPSSASRASGPGLLEYAASHPATRERLEYLRSFK